MVITRTTLAKEIEAGQVSGIVLSIPVSAPSSAISSRDSTFSYGVLVPINGPIVSPEQREGSDWKAPDWVWSFPISGVLFVVPDKWSGYVIL
jgi:hypothetical protein